jgi:hypothetical protein
MRRLAVFGVVLGTVLALCGPAFAGSGDQVWLKHFAGQDSCGEEARSMAVDSGSGTAYSLTRDGQCLLSQADLIAYSPSGSRKWAVNSGQWTDRPVQVAVDPDSHDVIVAGTRDQSLLVQAWSSAGTKLWGRTYGVKNSEIDVDGLVVDGHNRVFVGATVTVNGSGNTADFLTSAYKVSTGATLWHVRYDGTPHLSDTAVGIAIDPAKSELYVNGRSLNGERDQLVTIAYNSTTGAKKWGKRATEDTEDNVIGLAVDTTNHQVYSLTEPQNDAEIDLHAYHSTGSTAFHTTFGTGLLPEYIAVDPTNDSVYVGGWESTGGSTSQGVVVAFSASGAERWATLDTKGTSETADGLAVDTANHRVYLVLTDEISQQDHAVTLGVTSSGGQAWRATRSSPSADSGVDMGAVTADATRGQVYVCGEEIPASSDNASVVTIGYTA